MTRSMKDAVKLCDERHIGFHWDLLSVKGTAEENITTLLLPSNCSCKQKLQDHILHLARWVDGWVRELREIGTRHRFVKTKGRRVYSVGVGVPCAICDWQRESRSGLGVAASSHGKPLPLQCLVFPVAIRLSLTTPWPVTPDTSRTGLTTYLGAEKEQYRVHEVYGSLSGPCFLGIGYLRIFLT